MKKYVIVTGAYGGMGKSVVSELVSKGFGVFALDKHVEAAQEGVIPVCADITDEQDVAHAVEIVANVTDDVYAIMHFAGVYMMDSLVEMSPERFKKIFDVNLYGAYLVNRAFVPFLKSGARILLTTSELAPLDPLPFTGIYAVTKAALDKYAYSLRMELQLGGIYVSVLRAGAVDTGMLGESTSQLDTFVANTQRYSCNARRFKQIVDSVEAKAISTKKLAQKAVKVVTRRKPRFCYEINRNPLLRLLSILPKSLQLWIIKQVLK